MLVAIAVIAAVALTLAVGALVLWLADQRVRRSDREHANGMRALRDELERRDEQLREAHDRIMYLAGRPWGAPPPPATREELDAADDQFGQLLDPVTDLIEPRV